MPRYPHLLIEGQAGAERFTAVRARGREFLTPERNRSAHGQHLVGALTKAQNLQASQFPQPIGKGFYESPGLNLTFESDPNFPLAFESLDLTRSNIQLLSVRTDAENRTIATVHVPDEKVHILINRLEKYRDANPDNPQGRDYQKLAESIANIKLATLRELWTDDTNLFPDENVPFIWEVWLRSASSDEGSSLDRLREAAADLGYEVVSNSLTFVDRVVVLVRATRELLSRSVSVLGVIAEVRKAKVAANFYSVLSPNEQHAISDALVGRLTPPANGAPAIGLLDTGVNHAHPLLAPIMSQNDVQTLNPNWGVHDSYNGGHGTQMAGLCLYGDLVSVLSEEGPVTLTHGVQSLKLIQDSDPHPSDLYGAVTIEGVSRLEIDQTRPHIFCMAITAESRERGRPSSWSAAIDNLCCGAINNARRLILISAGNTPLDQRTNYPNYNVTSSVQDPAQSWNALTVGGYTEKAFIDQQEWDGWTLLATHGDLAPSSTTSMTWGFSNRVPIKPDIVMEAGNMGRPPGGGDPDFVEDLQLLTTNFRFDGRHRPFALFHDTSASAALAARIAAQLAARYPNFTAETLRGLMIHSARWNQAMRDRCVDAQGNVDPFRLLRTFGYGAPDSDALFSSANNSLTLIAQDSLQPFFKDQDGGVKSNEIKHHELPWPRDALLALPLNTPVEMRVTLSYFVEPSPGERGWDRKYGYPSHGLRFKVIRPTENLEEFKLRINAYGRDEEYDEDHAGETGQWMFGLVGPTAGSVHSNIWTGTAADLASRRHFAIHPTLGWWRTRPSEARYDRSSHYSLIVSVSTPAEEVDIYTPIANQIGIGVPVPV